MIPRLLSTASQKIEECLSEMDKGEEEQVWWWVLGLIIQELGFDCVLSRDLLAIQIEMSGVGNCLVLMGWVRTGTVHWRHQCIDVFTAS